MTAKSKTDSQLIDEKIAGLGDWRGKLLGRLRELIYQALPDVVEEVKWRKPSNPTGVALWSSNGMICTGEVYKDKVKLTFAHGASLEDPQRLFNASLDGGTRRAIDFREEDPVNQAALKFLMREAADFNATKKRADR